MKTEFYSNEDA